MHSGETVDCHQHVWPAALVDALRRRRTAPYLDGWTLHLDGEAPYDVDAADHDLELRAKQDRADGVGTTLLSLSSPLGIEHLHPDEARPLLDAWHTGEVESHHRRWAAPSLADPDLGDLAATLSRTDVIGLQVPATAMTDPASLERLAPRLALAEGAGLPVMVHPGPAPAGAVGTPCWWPALASYPAQQAAAWYAWHVAGRSLLGDLRICFVGLAGLAPLHHERLVARGGTFGAVDPGVFYETSSYGAPALDAPARRVARGGTFGAVDPGVFYETSSYGARAVDATARVVGVDPLVLGSDAPYAEAFDPRSDPGMGEAFAHALGVANPHRLLRPAPRPV